MSNEDYNGWTNKPTWLVKLWIDNDQGEQEYWLEQAKEVIETAGPTTFQSRESHQKSELADRLKDYFEEEQGQLLDGPFQASFWADLMSYALASVDWYEVANSFLEEAQELA